MSIALSVRNLKKSFGEAEVFRDFNMEIQEGEITVLFGPNGSGKSTILNILSEVIPYDGGLVNINGTDSFQKSYIFQNYRESLLPWRTNFENVALPLEIQKKSSREIRMRVENLQKLFEFECHWEGYPYELSGGQQQILAFMRALVIYPKILLIDEPFSALDYENNLRLREHLQKYYLAFRPSVLLVTHNIEEAVHLGKSILIFSQRPTEILGRVENPLPYPRTTQSLKSEEFHCVKDAVLSLFQKAARI